MTPAKNEHGIPANLKKWFWAVFLGQVIVTGGFLLIQWGATQRTLETNSEDIKLLKTEMQTKASINMVLQIKTDLKDNQLQMLEDLNYIRKRVDDLNDRKKTIYSLNQ